MVTTRRFEEKDAERCVEINLAAFKSFLAPKLGADHPYFKRFTAKEFLAGAGGRSEHGETATFVAEEDGKIVGLVKVSADSNGLGSFNSVAVDPNCFAKGVGAALMEAAEKFWAGWNQRKISTCVSAHNKRAVMYYLKHDFVPEGYRKDHFFVGVDEIILGRFLQQK